MNSFISDIGIDVLLKGNNMMRLLEGLMTALKISMISVVLSIFLGLILGMLMSLNKRAINAFSRIYLEILWIILNDGHFDEEGWKWRIYDCQKSCFQRI